MCMLPWSLCGWQGIWWHLDVHTSMPRLPLILTYVIFVCHPSSVASPLIQLCLGSNRIFRFAPCAPCIQLFQAPKSCSPPCWLVAPNDSIEKTWRNWNTTIIQSCKCIIKAIYILTKNCASGNIFDNTVPTINWSKLQMHHQQQQQPKQLFLSFYFHKCTNPSLSKYRSKYLHPKRSSCNLFTKGQCPNTSTFREVKFQDLEMKNKKRQSPTSSTNHYRIFNGANNYKNCKSFTMLWRPLCLIECFLEAKHAWCMKKTHNNKETHKKGDLRTERKKGGCK